MRDEARPAVLKWIIGYKLARAGVSVLGALALFGVLLSHRAEVLGHLAQALQRHAASALATTLSSLLLSVTEPHHLVVVAAALLLDGATVFLEGYSLLCGWRWATWLVVITSSALVPFEVLELVERFSAPRLLVLLINLAIVGWLIWRRVRR